MLVVDIALPCMDGGNTLWPNVIWSATPPPARMHCSAIPAVSFDPIAPGAHRLFYRPGWTLGP